MVQGDFDGFLFEEALMGLKESSLLCLYLKEKEPFPEILEYLDMLQAETPIELRIYKSQSEVDAQFIKKVSAYISPTIKEL
jgi:3'-phosphoadenosine 5'-phosphosulfate sulfotransferase (PAPS reductase)/FAD synthetase